MCDPYGHPEYDILLLLAIVGIAVGALAIQCFDKTLVTSFIFVIMVSIKLRLLTGPDRSVY